MRPKSFINETQHFNRYWEDAMANPRTFHSFADFYPFYLSEHVNPTCRVLHFVGTTLAAVLLTAAVVTQRWWLIPVALLEGYTFAWIGHFFFEHNRPATFQHPVYSFLGDWRMWWDILTRARRLRS